MLEAQEEVPIMKNQSLHRFLVELNKQTNKQMQSKVGDINVTWCDINVASSIIASSNSVTKMTVSPIYQCHQSNSVI